MKVTWNRRAWREIRTSPEVQEFIEQKTHEIANRCGDGYEPSVERGKARLHGSVITDTYEAKADNARNNTLLRSMYASGGQ